MSNHKVYKYSLKGLRNVKDVGPDDRIIFMGGGQGAVAYNRRTMTIVQSDLFYRRPDSHTTLTDEPCPDSLTVTDREWQHIIDNQLRMPCEIVKVSR